MCPWTRLNTARSVSFDINIRPLWPFVLCLSFVNNGYNKVTTPTTNQRFWPDSAQILRHQYGISAAETQTFLSAKRHQRISKSSKNILYSLIMTVALTSPRQWALWGDDVVVETRVWPNEALFTVWPLKPGPPKNFLLQQIRNRSLINS